MTFTFSLVAFEVVVYFVMPRSVEQSAAIPPAWP